MAHEVEAMLYTGETPWHRIGQKFSEDESNDVDYLKSHPSIAWTCEKRPLFLSDGREAATMAVVRSSDSRILGEVGRDYTIVQNHEASHCITPSETGGDDSAGCACGPAPRRSTTGTHAALVIALGLLARLLSRRRRSLVYRVGR